VAVGDSTLSQIDNPASLALRPRSSRGLDFAGQFATPFVEWSGPIDSVDSEVNFIPVVNMGFADPVDDKLTWGLAVHSKSGLGTSYHARHLLIPWTDRHVHSDMKNASVSLNVGYRLTKKLSVGAGLRGEGVTAEFSEVLGPVDVEFERGYATGVGCQFGLHYQVRKDVALGLAYRSPTWCTDLAGGDAEASFLGLAPVGLGHANIDRFRLPQKISAGVAWDATDRLKLVGEARWLGYPDTVVDSMRVATDGWVDLRVALPLGYQDQWALAAGAEYELDQHWTLASGYHYCTNPIPRSNLSPIGSIIAQHHLTIGLRYERDNWWVGGGYIVALPASLSASGQSDIPMGIDYGDGEIWQVQHSVSVGFGFSW